MNIAIVGPSPVPFSIGGIENMLWGMTNYINQNTNHHCELIKLPSKEDSFWNIINSYKAFWNLDVSHFDMVISTKYPAWMVKHNNHICYLAHRLRGLYDTYHFTKLPKEFYGNDILVNEILKFMESSFHNPDMEKFFSYMDDLFENKEKLPEDIFGFPHPFIRKLVHYMDNAALSNNNIKQFYCISNTVKDRTEYFPKGAIPNVIYLPSFLNDFKYGDYKYLFTVSRLDGPKRINMMIEAMKYVDEDIDLIIAGKGPEEAYLKNLATSDKRIKFVGFVNDDDVINYYSNALAVLYVPYEEDYGLVTIEAMMSKKPVLTCSDSGGTNEFVKHKLTGLIANPDPKSLAEQIKYICKNKLEAKIMGEKGYELVREISWPNTISALLDETSKHTVNIKKGTLQKRIVVTSHFSIYPPRGGGQSRIFNLYKQVSKKFDVEIVCMGNNKELEVSREVGKGLIETIIPKTALQAEKEWEYEKEIGIPVSDSVLPIVSQLTPKYGEKLHKAIDKSDIIILSHPYLLYEVEKYRGNKPFIYEAHNIEFLLKRSSYKNNNKVTNKVLDLIYKVEREACLKSNLIMTCSEEDKYSLAKLYDISFDKFIIVPNGVECKEIKYILPEKRCYSKKEIGLEEEFIAIFIGSWHPPNIEACSYIIEMARKAPKIKFLIIGSVCQALKDKEIPQNVGLMGVVSEIEKKRILGIADIALNPITSGSGTNLKMFDYMASGVPIVTTEFGTRGIGGGSKYFFISSIDDMSSIITNIISGDLRTDEMVIAARGEVEKNFDWQAISRRLTDNLDSILL